jgi:uncharacterized membrane protein HdeD (DUF308 family)
VIYYLFVALFIATGAIWICVAIKERRETGENMPQNEE